MQAAAAAAAGFLYVAYIHIRSSSKQKGAQSNLRVSQHLSYQPVSAVPEVSHNSMSSRGAVKLGCREVLLTQTSSGLPPSHPSPQEESFHFATTPRDNRHLSLMYAHSSPQPKSENSFVCKQPALKQQPCLPRTESRQNTYHICNQSSVLRVTKERKPLVFPPTKTSGCTLLCRF